MNDAMKKIGELGVLPLITVNDPDDALRIGEAFLKGGLPAAEVTFRTAAAEKSIAALTKEMPEIFVGAGTVLTTEQADRAAGAGAKFAVSPGLNPKVVSHCLKTGLPIAPGICTPTDIEAAMELGLNVLKFFPAEAMGGLKTLKAVSAPYGNIIFIPTGGVNAENLPEYLRFKKVLACGGTWIAPNDLIEAKKYDEIARLARAAVEIAASARAKA